MGIKLKNLSELKTWLASYKVKGINLLLGAGISRDPPANAPIWSEMQLAFLNTVFDRMEEEGWPISSEFSADKNAISKHNIRPETFWARIMEVCDVGVIKTAFKTVNAGSSNVNHKLVAHLLNSGVCIKAVTTNFDEYVEPLLEDHVKVWIPTTDQSLDGVDDSPYYVKLHGTLESPSTLSYTLEHYDLLKTRNLAIFRRLLTGRPLLVLGYSGYDSDVLPAILEMKKEIPLLVVAQHPGSDIKQPINKFCLEVKNGYLIETRCHQVLSQFSDATAYSNPSEATLNSTLPHSNAYRQATKAIPLPLCPLIVMTAFAFVGDRKKTNQYAMLAHDAAVDERYLSSTSPEALINLHLMAGEALVAVGNDMGANIMFSEAKSIANTAGSSSQVLKSMLAGDVIRGRLSLHSDSSEVDRGLRALAALQDFRERFTNEKETAKNSFETAWQSGIMTRRSGDLDAALGAFFSAASILRESDHATHLERAHFFLDFAGAVYEKGASANDGELMEHAASLYSICEKESKEVADWHTHAKSLFMLSKVWTLLQILGDARKAIEQAEVSSHRTHDKELQDRIAAQKTLVKLLQAKAEKE